MFERAFASLILCVGLFLAGCWNDATYVSAGAAGGAGGKPAGTTTASAGGAGGEPASTTTASAMGGGGAGDAGVHCSISTDCPAQKNLCVVNTCTNDTCGTKNVAEGTIVEKEMATPCMSLACDGNGNTMPVVDLTNIPTPANECEIGTCTADGGTGDTPAAMGASCSMGGVCDGAGHCLGCLSDKDCTAAPNVSCDPKSNTCVCMGTGTSCGGAQCPPCPVGQGCIQTSDCTPPGGCDKSTKTCDATQCNDDQLDGTETDVDCGGAVCDHLGATCALGLKCAADADCTSMGCDVTSKTCVNECADGLKDGLETAVDCGGPGCAPCANGQTCHAASDCVSGACANGVLCAPWAIGGTGQNMGGHAYGTSVAADATTGNIAVVGYFSGSVTIPSFAPAGPEHLLTALGANDLFVAIFNQAGTLIRARSFGAGGNQYVYGNGVAMYQGDIFVTGGYSSSVLFDGYGLTGGAGLGLVVRMDGKSGDVDWAKTLPWSGPNAAGEAIGVDGQGNVVVTGSANGDGSIVVTKLSVDGSFQWSSPLFGNDPTENTQGQSVAIDSDGAIVLAGQFAGSIDFGNGVPAISAGTGRSDAFVAKLGSDGSAVWAHGFSSTGQAAGQSIVVDGAGNVFVGGSFIGTTANKLSGNVNCPGLVGYTDLGGFLVSFDPMGNCRWSQSVLTPDDTYSAVAALALDATGSNLLVAGGFGMNPGNELSFCGQAPFVASGGDALFLSEISASTGSCSPGGMALSFSGPQIFPGAPQSLSPGALAVNPFGGVVLAGTFNTAAAMPETIDFGSGPILGGPNGDVFLASLGQPAGETCLLGSDCMQTCCGGACVDTTSDPRNCGTCGHDCLEGACLASTCQAVAIASGLDAPQALAVDANYVYWTNSGSVANGGSAMQCAIENCNNHPLTLAADLEGPQGIVVDAMNVYWTGSGEVMQCAIGGCQLNPVTIADENGHFIALASNRLYWTTYAGGLGVRTCALPGCGAVSTFAQAVTPQPIAVDAVNVYWGDANAPTPMNGFVKECPLGGACPSATLLASNQYNPSAIALDAANVYWSLEDGASILSCPIAGCPGGPTLLAANVGQLEGIAVDDTYVYWNWFKAGDELSSLFRCQKASPAACAGSHYTLVDGAGPGGSISPQQIVVDAKYVYWVDEGTLGQMNGRIMKVAK